MGLLVRGGNEVERPRPCGRGGAGNMRIISEEESKAAEIAETETDDQSEGLSRQGSSISRNSSWSSLNGRSLLEKFMKRRGSKTEEALEPEEEVSREQKEQKDQKDQ